MIKWVWYWKSLKQLFIIWLISCFILLGSSFVSAFSCQSNSTYWINCWDIPIWHTVEWSWYVSAVRDSNFNFISNTFDYISPDWIYRLSYWWQSDWLYFNYVKRSSWLGSRNWKISWFFVCSSRPSAWKLSNNSTCDYYFNFVDIGSFLVWVDTYSYNISNLVSSTNNPIVCVYKSGFSQFVCFDWLSYYSIEDSIALSSAEVSSRAISNPFVSNLDQWWSNSWSGWISIDFTDSYISWDYVYTNCTYKQIFDYAESFWYNNYLCYWWLDNFDNFDSTATYNPIPWSWKTLWQILTYSRAWETPNDWFIYRNWLYKDKYNESYNAMWESYPAVYRTRFDLYYRYGWDWLIFDTVREYCAMKSLDVDFASTEYKWKYFAEACNNIKNWAQYWYDIYDSSWNVVVWPNRNWVWNISWTSVINDPVLFIQNFFNLAKSKLPTRYDLGGWFLPVYIITFLLAIILFRFLSH